jgi:hypothetical protein
MRYPKGCISLSARHDAPLLAQVLQCGFVSHQQLWEFMVHELVERRRDAFGRRVKRLVDHGFLDRQALSGRTRSFVYSLTEDGASELVGFERHIGGATAFFDRKRDRDRVLHALELNEIHLALCRSGFLRRWMSEVEIRSRNELTACGYGKDYDAIIKLQLREQEVALAIEYERQAKGQSRYAEIAAAIQREQRVDLFLYLLPDYELLLYVRGFFEQVRRRIYFGISADFKRDLLKARVFDVGLVVGSLPDVV